MSDALDRLRRRRRKRPTVPSRDTHIDESLQIQIPGNPDTENSRHIQSDPESQKKSSDLETKQTTLRLDSALAGRLQKTCRRHNLSREVLIEAMFEQCEENQTLMQAVLEQAQIRNEHRKQRANRKRAESMIKNLGGSTG